MKKKKHNKLFMFSNLQHNLPLNFSHPWQLIHNKKINLWNIFLVFKTSSPHMFRLLRPLHIKNITVNKLSITQDHFSTTHYSGNSFTTRKLIFGTFSWSSKLVLHTCS